MSDDMRAALAKQFDELFNGHPLAWAWVAGLAAVSGERGRDAWVALEAIERRMGRD